MQISTRKSFSHSPNHPSAIAPKAVLPRHPQPEASPEVWVDEPQTHFVVSVLLGNRHAPAAPLSERLKAIAQRHGAERDPVLSPAEMARVNEGPSGAFDN